MQSSQTEVAKIRVQGSQSPTPVLLPGKSHGRRSLVGCSPWGRTESDTTKRLHFHFSLSCTGEGNGNLLQCSCLENPKDGGAWWAAVYGVAQSQTRLKRRSSSSSRPHSPSRTVSLNMITVTQTVQGEPRIRGAGPRIRGAMLHPGCELRLHRSGHRFQGASSPC